MEIPDRRVVFCVWVLSVLVSIPATAWSATLVVDTREDASDVAAGDGVCADNAGRCTLRAALEEANSLPGPDTVTLPEGKFALFDQAAPGSLLVVTDATTLVGAGEAETVLTLAAGIKKTLGRTGSARILDSSGDLNVSDLSIVGGTLGSGGCGAGIRSLGTLRLERVRLVKNKNPFGDGGALCVLGGGQLIDVAILKNKAKRGGGIYTEGVMDILASTIRDNRNVHFGTGAGIFNAATGTLTVGESLIYHNTTRLGCTDTSGSDGGGGLRNDGTAVLANVTLYYNRARRSCGGAIRNDGKLEMVNVSMFDNQARYRTAGLVNLGYATVVNSVFAGNDSHGTEGGSCSGVPPISLGHNVETVTNSCGFVASGDRTGVSATGLIQKPGENGGPTLAPILPAGSLLVDAADEGYCFPVDQRGFARPRDGDGDGVAKCDIGAVEGVHASRRTPTRTATTRLSSPTPTQTPTTNPVATPTETPVPPSSETPTADPTGPAETPTETPTP